MRKVGVFLSRFQPIHNAHLWMMENALKENDTVIVLVGSANKYGTERNPFKIEDRLEMVENAVKEHFKGEEYKEKTIKIVSLSDWSSEQNNSDQEWGRLIYYSVVGVKGVKTFSFYSSEEPEKIKGWFEEEIRERINFKFFSRKNSFEGLSATKIREAILNDDIEYIKKYCPNCVLKNRIKLKELIKSSKGIA